MREELLGILLAIVVNSTWHARQTCRMLSWNASDVVETFAVTTSQRACASGSRGRRLIGTRTSAAMPHGQCSTSGRGDKEGDSRLCNSWGAENCVWERDQEHVGTDVPVSSYQRHQSVVRTQVGMHQLHHGIPHIFLYLSIGAKAGQAQDRLGVDVRFVARVATMLPPLSPNPDQTLLRSGVLIPMLT